MNSKLESINCNNLKSHDVKIMTQASVFLTGEPSTAVEVRRGMIVKCKDGREAGRLAGVIVSQDGGQVLCLILSHLPDQAGYQSLPTSWIGRVSEDGISLTACIKTILALPDWHST